MSNVDLSQLITAETKAAQAAAGMVPLAAPVKL